MEGTSSMELVFIPTPAMGHLLSAVEVAYRILHRNQRLSIFFIIIEGGATISTISAFLDSKSKNNPCPSRLIFHTIPPPSNPPDPSSPTFFQDIVDLPKPLVKQAVEDRLQVVSSRLGGFIFDMLYIGMMDVAAEFKVPSFVFMPSGANFIGLMFYFQSLADDQGVDIAAEFSDPDAEFDLPGFVNRVRGNALPGPSVDKESGGSSTMLNMARNFRKSNGILVNTFKELEPCGVQALFDQVAKKTIPPVYPVGPILELNDSSRGWTQGECHKSIKEWLDDQPLSSVVFIGFGSLGTINQDQVKEIAKGLENSGHRFLWSLRKPPPEGKFGMPGDMDDTFVEALPEGFLDRTAGRGKVIGWASQVLILAHSSVGGFVSHCGWNSTLESMWFGVPIATWPFQYEQQLNAFELVKELGLAVEIRNDYKYDWITQKANIIVTAEEVEDGVKKLMNLNEGIKSRVREISHKSRKTLDEGGSSYECLGRFVQDLWNNLE